MIPALSVECEAWQDWLGDAAASRFIRNVELPGELLEQYPQAKTTVAAYGLKTVHVRNAVSPQITRYLADKPRAFQQKVCYRCVEQLSSLINIGIRSVDLDIGLHRIDESDDANDMTARVKILRDLVAGIRDESMVLALPVRYPPVYPGAKEWQKAANIIHDVMHPSCKLGLDVFPPEVPAEDLSETIRRIYFSADFIRFHYQPRIGDDLQSWNAQAWLQRLREHGFRRKLIFCPKIRYPENRAEACQAIDALLGMA